MLIKVDFLKKLFIYLLGHLQPLLYHQIVTISSPAILSIFTSIHFISRFNNKIQLQTYFIFILIIDSAYINICL